MLTADVRLAAEKRVVCDFTITFQNGGGIQGQGFRLDIHERSISDQDLSDRIVKELGLLMVDEVQIQNKQVIEEPHKGPTLATTGEPRQLASYVDLSHTVYQGLITYKGLPAPIICDFLSRQQSREIYDEGTTFQIGRIDMVANTGTYIDSPFHRFANGKDLSELELPSLAELNGVVARVAEGQGRAIDRQVFLPLDVRGRAVLVETGWSQYWDTEAYFENHPYLTRSAAEHLREAGATLVGIDSYNIDDTSDGKRPVHTVLLEAGIPIVEHMCNLQALPVEGFHFSAVPAKVKGMGTFPVRAYAVLHAS